MKHVTGTIHYKHDMTHTWHALISIPTIHNKQQNTRDCNNQLFTINTRDCQIHCLGLAGFKPMAENLTFLWTNFLGSNVFTRTTNWQDRHVRYWHRRAVNKRQQLGQETVGPTVATVKWFSSSDPRCHLVMRNMFTTINWQAMNNVNKIRKFQKLS